MARKISSIALFIVLTMLLGLPAQAGPAVPISPDQLKALSEQDEKTPEPAVEKSELPDRSYSTPVTIFPKTP